MHPVTLTAASQLHAQRLWQVKTESYALGDETAHLDSKTSTLHLLWRCNFGKRKGNHFLWQSYIKYRLSVGNKPGYEELVSTGSGSTTGLWWLTRGQSRPFCFLFLTPHICNEPVKSMQDFTKLLEKMLNESIGPQSLETSIILNTSTYDLFHSCFKIKYQMY